MYACAREIARGSPSNKFVEDVDVFLDFFCLYGFFCFEDSEWRHGCAILDIAATWLEQTTDEYDFKEGIGIFEEFKSRASLS
jgi:hypothetical protein